MEIAVEPGRFLGADILVMNTRARKRSRKCSQGLGSFDKNRDFITE
jgi:hypothetical protein